MKRRKVVLHFSAQMEGQLQANDYKTGWLDCNPQELHTQLDRHSNDLFKELDLVKEDNPTIIRKCVNMANFAMMIADYYDKRIGDK